MSITKRMGEIYTEYQTGIPIEVLAVRYQISEGSIRKKIKKVEVSLRPKPQKLPVAVDEVRVIEGLVKWNEDNIRAGIVRYFDEQGSFPTSRDFDEVDYLPSARQVQRAFGGLVSLRTKLGFTETDYTRGDLRKSIAIKANTRGLTAEENFEKVLIDIFGEPFVHTQKRYYKNSKNRYDFFIYANNFICGIDIFTTDRSHYIEKNIRHKVTRYKNAPRDLEIYFVLVGDEYTPELVANAAGSIGELAQYPNMHAMHEKEFLALMREKSSLSLPHGFIGLDDLLP